MKGKIAAGQKCRSTLECTGDLRCVGVGPTTPGKCGPARAPGEVCGGTVDTLAGYVRQTDLDKRHPECRGTDRCIKHKCAAPAADGAACQTTSDCADGLQCVPAAMGAPKIAIPQKKCAGRAMPKEGEACPGGVCDGNDFECKGGCLKPDGGDKGKCGPRCDIR